MTDRAPGKPKKNTVADQGMVRTIAQIALFNKLSDTDITSLLRSFSISRLRSQMVSLGVCEPDAPDHVIAQLYFSGRCRIISPNAFFDEAWYCEQYCEVAGEIKAGRLVSGFVHYIERGIKSGFWPNGILHAQFLACTSPGVPREKADWARYLERHPGAAAFIKAFPFLSAKEHYHTYGRFLEYDADAPRYQRASEPLSLRIAHAEFDAAFYARTYLTASVDAAYRTDPFEHYLQHGMRAGLSPNEWFEEDWYRAFYKEVRDGIESGWLPSGFYHYMLSGRTEGRLPKRDLGAALEVRMPGVTNPVLLARADMLRERMAGLRVLPELSPSRRRKQTIWIFLPTLNPDIMYGGYRAVLALICAFYRDGKNVAVVCTEDELNLAYFQWSEKSSQVRTVFSAIKIVDLKHFVSGTVGRSDLFVAYTVWDLVACRQLAELTASAVPILLAQEFEPIFHDNGAIRALCEACYRIPHYPIINSHFLAKYFSENKIGVFARNQPCQGRDYTVFEHKVSQLPVQTATSMRTRSHRVMAVYARPEAHAARNLFELVVLALEALCAEGAFGPEWRFIGLGALTRILPVPLGAGHELKLMQKMSEEEYWEVCSEMDIGVSLMYAPHPSVMPFEFATTGALVVTNVYENRSAADLQAISFNIVPCEISVDSLVVSIRQAISRVANFAQRERDTLRLRAQSWDDIFSTEFIRDCLSAVSDTNVNSPATMTDADVAMLPPGRLAEVAQERTLARG